MTMLGAVSLLPIRLFSFRLLLLVSLYCALVADLRRVGVLAGVAPASTLSEQVPALVELHFDVLQPLMLRRVIGVSAEEFMLLVYQPLDRRQHILVVHAAPR
jgi:hypothetical protein